MYLRWHFVLSSIHLLYKHNSFFFDFGTNFFQELVWYMVLSYQFVCLCVSLRISPVLPSLCRSLRSLLFLFLMLHLTCFRNCLSALVIGINENCMFSQISVHCPCLPRMMYHSLPALRSSCQVVVFHSCFGSSSILH